MEINWAWGLSLIALTIMVHGIGLALMAVGLQLLRLRLQVETRTRLRLGHYFLTLIFLTTTVGLLLVILDGIEAGLWAVAYWWLGALRSPSEAILYSVDSMSTRGASGLMLEHRWRMLGALEATNGMLLFGISTAFIFAVMQRFWVTVTQQLRQGT